MEINETFYIDKYNDAYNFANKNDLSIAEINADEKGRKFKLVKILPNDIDIKTDELRQLKDWYNNYYTQHEQKYRRLHSLGKLTDNGKDPYNELINLYNEAEIKRARIQELERLLSDSSK